MQKERYYNLDTIQEKSQELLAFVEASRRRHADIVFQPGKAALLVLDMQKYFLDVSSHAYIPSAPAIVSRINKLVAAFVRAGCPVIVTRHVNTLEDAGMMAKWWRDMIKPEIAYSHLLKTFSTPNLIPIIKTQYDAFLKTTLKKTLRQHSVNQVVITGVMTHLCCETTARSAFMRGFEVFFTVDGTATYNEDLHRASLLTLSHGFAVPVLIEELLADMEPDEA